MGNTLRLAAATLLLLTACSREEEVQLQEQPPAARPPSAAAAAGPASVTARSADGARAVTVTFNGEVNEISLAEGTQARLVRGEPRESGKRKYSVDGGDVLFEVKSDADGDFKLRAADGSLRWKVKVDPDKIRISDNEQNDNPFQLKKRDGDRVKVFGRDDRELGNVRFDRAASKLVVEDAAGKELYVVETAAPSAAWGVLLLDGIPDIQRQVLVAEILARGR